MKRLKKEHTVYFSDDKQDKIVKIKMELYGNSK